MSPMPNVASQQLPPIMRGEEWLQPIYEAECGATITVTLERQSG